MDIGAKIKASRKSKGINQKQLAEILKVSESMVSQYERGLKKPKIETIQKIASALGVSPVDITGWDYFDQTANVDLIADEVRALEAVQAAFGKKACDVLGDFSQLNETGQAKAAEYVSDLTDQPKYKK